MAISSSKEFVQECLARGVARAEIQRALKAGGWPDREIEESLAAYVDAGLPIPVPLCKASVSPREAFLYLLLFSSLFLWIFSLGSLYFDFINVLLPLSNESADYFTYSLRYGVAMLVIAFPVYLFTENVIQKDLVRNPARGIAPVRRWLTYLTLFVATLTLVGDAVALIVRFLEGEITLRFFLKVAVIAGLASGVFAYLFRTLASTEVSREVTSIPVLKHTKKLLTMIVIIVCVTSIYITGGPLQARLVSQDNQRENDVRDIYYRVQNYYTREEKLPETLADCDINPSSFIQNKKDPITGAPYSYQKVDDSKFQISAKFNLKSKESSSRGKNLYWRPQDRDFWNHDAGWHTFTIDLGQPRSK
ncbi:MAG: DUF5671 domain-containing protein [Verrucomicrobiota bacterium]